MCEYYERGLTRPDVDNDIPDPWMKSICDPMDDEGNIIISQRPGLGMEFNWDYINDNLVKP